MTPERAAYVFRELMQTPTEQLSMYPQRAGLLTRPNQDDLERARELLFALAEALAVPAGPEWAKVQSAWTALRQGHGVTQSAGAPKPPKWVRELPPEPSLGDPAPGTVGHQAMQRKQERFVPAAQPVHQSPGQQTAGYHGHQGRPAGAYGEAYASAGQQQPYPAQGHPGHSNQPAPAANYGQPLAQSAPQHRPVPQHAPPPPPRRHQGGPPPEATAAQTTQGPGLDFSAWTVSKYAAFCAACSVYPDRVQQTQHDYGIGDDACRRRLDDHWSDVFDDDGAAHQQWEQLVRQFRDNLRRR